MEQLLLYLIEMKEKAIMDKGYRSRIGVFIA